MADIQKVKRNIERMLQQGAPEQDIDAYIASEGVTLDMLHQPDPVTPEGTLKSVGSGIVKGAIGLGTMAYDVANMATGALDSALGIKPEQRQAIRQAQSGLGVGVPVGNRQAMDKIERDIVPMHRPSNKVERYADTTGQFIPSMFVGPGSLPMRIASGITGALGSEAAGQATEGLSVPIPYTDKRIPVEPIARIAGAIGGGALPDIGRRALTPNPVNPARNANREVLRREGVPVTAGQFTGRKGLGFAESEIGGGATQNIMERQAEEFTRAASRRYGGNTTRLLPEELGRTFDDLGRQFDDLAMTTHVPLDQQVQDDMLRAVMDYNVTSGAPARAAEDVMNRIAELSSQNGGVLDGPAYKQVMSDISRWTRGSNDEGLKTALRGIKEALDDGIERNIGGQLRNEWRQLRRNYRNLLVVEDAMVNGTEKSAEGLMNPHNLGASIEKIEGTRPRSTGRSDFSSLANAGQNLLKPLPNSGTASRNAVRNLGAGALALLGGGAGVVSGAGLGGVAAGAAGGLALPFVAGRALMSRPMQAYLANQLFPTRGATAGQNIAKALLGTSPKNIELILRKLEEERNGP